MSSSAGSLRSRVWKYVGLAVLTLCAILAAMLALTPPAPHAAEGEAQDFPTLTFDAERPLAVFIGGSQAAGAGASDTEQRWTSLLADGRGWEEENIARSETGYVTAAEPAMCAQDRCPSFRDSVAETVAQGPGVVVVSGGDRDLGLPPSEVGDAIAATYRGLRTGLPNATIIAVGPMFTTSAPSQDILAIDAAVQEAASSIGATYVSLIAPNVLNPSMLSADGTVINDAGHAAVAARVAAAL